MKSSSLVIALVGTLASAQQWHTATIKELGHYPGYNGSARIHGYATLHFEHNDTVTAHYELHGVEAECHSPAEGVANSCGIHIHEGKSCSDAAAPGGHYYNKV